MLIETIGRPRHTPLRVVKKAVNFYGEYLFGQNKKLFNNVKVTVRFQKFEKGDYDYAYCDWEYDNHRSRDFIITVDSKLNKKETLLALAHEMVHVKQYVKGEMKDIFRPAKMVKWFGENYNAEEMDYWEQPWEIEAYGREKGLYFKFVTFGMDEF